MLQPIRNVGSNGTIWWSLNGVLHREDGPAAIEPNGSFEWRWKGEFHRDGGPAVNKDGILYWYQHGVLHREDGPALEYPSGAKMWVRNGLYYRTDGPAVIDASGAMYWWINHRHVTVQVQQWIADNDMNPDYRQWSKAEWCLFRLTFT